jgi:hypothetical protein
MTEPKKPINFFKILTLFQWQGMAVLLRHGDSEEHVAIDIGLRVVDRSAILRQGGQSRISSISVARDGGGTAVGPAWVPRMRSSQSDLFARPVAVDVMPDAGEEDLPDMFFEISIVDLAHRLLGTAAWPRRTLIGGGEPGLDNCHFSDCVTGIPCHIIKCFDNL